METHTFDASKEPLGRMATKIAVLLMGKHLPSFEHRTIAPIRVIVTHSDNILLTGRKWQNKRYHRHSGYIGNLKEFSADEIRRRDSRKLVRLAVMGMLPKNKLRRKVITHLAIYKGNSPRSK